MPSSSDKELASVVTRIRSQDPDGQRTAIVLRETIDQLYDGQRTGRYRWDQLFKTEKTHCGTLVEINLQREFEFEDGVTLDFRIAGVDVDCKYSQTVGGWMIPPEAHGHLCMLLSATDNEAPKWNMGIVRINDGYLNVGANRDAKATLNVQGREAIQWIFKDMPLPPNVLLQLERATVDRIMALPHGTKRINELFRCAVGRIVGRNVVATVGQQSDYMKRVRKNGGARSKLKSEGIVVLGQFKNHVAIARALRLPIPNAGESVSVRLTHATSAGPGVAEIGGKLWRVAKSTDPVVAAPDLPKI